MTAGKTQGNFCQCFNIRTFGFYLALTLVIPAITIIIEYLVTNNPSFRASLLVDLHDFHVYQLLSASLVHVNFAHFVGNITAYLLIVIYGLVLATVLIKKRLYLFLTKAIVGIFIVFAALFTFVNMNSVYYAGLSGIDAALAGLLLLFWLMYLGELMGTDVGSYYGVAIVGTILLSMGIVTRYLFLYHATKHSLLVYGLAVMAVLLILAVILWRNQLAAILHAFRGFDCQARLLTLAIIPIFAYFIWNLFPQSLQDPTRTTSVTLHISGLMLGVLAGYLCMVYLVQVAYFSNERESILPPPH
jgi:hypothetical protein